MIQWNNKFLNKKRLSAIDINDEKCQIEKQKNQYTIFNTSMEEYWIVLDKSKTNCPNEIYRAMFSFFNKKTEQFDIDFATFRDFFVDNTSILAILIDAIEHASTIGWCAKKDSNSQQTHNIVIGAELGGIADEYLKLAKTKTFVRYLQDMPSNLINPLTFTNTIKEQFANVKNVEIEVLEEKELKDKGMNLITAVGQGSANDSDKSRIVVIKYMNDSNSTDINCFIGKGICFDTGGLNIKTGNYMRWMKYDMSGSAIVAGLAKILAVNNIKTNFIAVCALSTNLCGSQSYRPDDVLTAYNGMTVEIDNTDAEGRLVMADALAYAVKDLGATKLYDIATLTGAMTYALGDTYTGVWTNCDEMWNNLISAAKQSGELVWRLPFHHDFKDLLKSQFADICNSVSDPRGGSSRAAMFLKEFTNNLPYMHFDVAATADKGNVGTGIMLHTMYNYFKNKQ